MLNNWITSVLGLVVAAVVFLDLSDSALAWTLVILGVSITASSLWGADVRRDSHTQAMSRKV